LHACRGTTRESRQGGERCCACVSDASSLCREAEQGWGQHSVGNGLNKDGGSTQWATPMHAGG